MTQDRELREALRAAAAAPPAGLSVDAGAARREGDKRMRTRTAMTTSLAFSFVVLAGFGSIFIASHRARPSTLGADGTVASPSAATTVTPTPAPVTSGGIYFDGPLIAGRPATLVVQAAGLGAVQSISIRWGDTQSEQDPPPAGVAAGGASVCPDVTPSQASAVPPLYARESHLYATPGTVVVGVSVTPVCGAPYVTSYPFQVLAAPVIPRRQPYAPPSRPAGLPASSQQPVASTSPTASPSPSEISMASPAPSPGAKSLGSATPTGGAVQSSTAQP